MDNAAKAILLAGGILIGVMLISIFAYVLTSFRSFQETMDTMKVSQEVLRFNNKFEPYITKQSGDSYIKGWQVYNLLGIAIDENLNSDGMFEIKVRWKSNNPNDYKSNTSDLLSHRDNFFYTEHLNDNYSVTIDGYGPKGEIEKINIQ